VSLGKFKIVSAHGFLTEGRQALVIIVDVDMKANQKRPLADLLKSLGVDQGTGNLPTARKRPAMPSKMCWTGVLSLPGVARRLCTRKPTERITVTGWLHSRPAFRST
jgi:hypothetical protein